MSRRTTRHHSPTIHVVISEAQYERARRSNSGACLIADAIKAAHPEFTKVSVDMATIRVTDTKAGFRYTYLTPPPAQHVLLSFDQGWKNPIDDLVVKRAVHIRAITRPADGPKSASAAVSRAVDRIATFEERIARGETLTKQEKSRLTMDRKLVQTAPKRPVRPHTEGPAEVVAHGRHNPVVVGGKSPPMGPSHPNLLRGSNRHFGAKLSDPGQVFHDAVEAAVAARLADRDE